MSQKVSKVAMYVCMCILLIAFVSARQDIVILDKEVFDGGTVEVDEITYKLHVGDEYDGTTVAFQAPNWYHFIDNGDCDFFNESRVCVSEMTNVSTSGNKWKAQITVYSSVANVTASGSVSDPDIYEGEETTYTATVINNGGHKADNLSFSIELPDNIILTSLERLYENSTHVYYNKDFDADESITFSMSFRMRGNDNTTFQPTVSYFDIHGKQTIINLDEEEVSSESFCNFAYNISSSTMGVDDDGNFSIFFYNENFTNVSIEDLVLRTPEQISIYERERIAQKSKNKFYYNGIIGFNKSRTLQIFYTGFRGGKSDINLTFKCRINNDDIYATVDRSIPIEVYEKAISFETSFLDNEYAEAGTSKEFVLNVLNTYSSQAISITHVNISIDNKTSSNPLLNIIPALSSKNIINTTILVPEVLEDKEVPIEVLIRYKNALDEDFVYSKNFTLNIYTLTLDVEQSVDKLVLEEGEKATVSVVVKNSNNRAFSKLRAYDLTSLVTSQTPDISFEIGSFTTKEVYNYTVLAPFVEEAQEFPIQTFVEVDLDGRSRLYTAENIIEVKPKKEEATTENTTNALDLVAEGFEETPQTENSSFTVTDVSQEEVEASKPFYESNIMSVVILVLVGLLLVVAVLMVKMKGQREKHKKKYKKYAPLKHAFHPALDEVRDAISKAKKGILGESSSKESQKTPSQSTTKSSASSSNPPSSEGAIDQAHSKVEEMLKKLEGNSK